MKKTVALVCAAIMVCLLSVTLVTAKAEADSYTIDYGAVQQYVACCADEYGCYTVVTDIFGLLPHAFENNICSLYGIECDGLFNVEYLFEDGKFITLDEFGELEYVTVN